MGRTLTYPKTKIPNSTINRYDSRGKYFNCPLTADSIRSILNSPPGTYDLETIHNIINTTSVLHVSFSPGPEDPFPAILPVRTPGDIPPISFALSSNQIFLGQLATASETCA